METSVKIDCDCTQPCNHSLHADTITDGHRSFDILHVATALQLEAEEFLTFDERQRRLAQAESLKVKPKADHANGPRPPGEVMARLE